MNNLAKVKKYNYAKNYKILMIINLLIAIPFAFFVSFSGISSLLAGGFEVIVSVGIFIVLAGFLIYEIFRWCNARKEQEKEFNKKTPDFYISYIGNNEITILNKQYSLSEILSVDYECIKKSDLWSSWIIPSVTSNGEQAVSNEKEEKKMKAYEKMILNLVKKGKTAVGNIFIELKNTR